MVYSVISPTPSSSYSFIRHITGRFVVWRSGGEIEGAPFAHSTIPDDQIQITGLCGFTANFTPVTCHHVTKISANYGSYSLTVEQLREVTSCLNTMLVKPVSHRTLNVWYITHSNMSDKACHFTVQVYNDYSKLSVSQHTDKKGKRSET